MKKSTKGILLCVLGLALGYTAIFVSRTFNFTGGEVMIHGIITCVAMCGCIAGGTVLIFNDNQP